jgi:hypothetical protein
MRELLRWADSTTFFPSYKVTREDGSIETWTKLVANCGARFSAGA